MTPTPIPTIVRALASRPGGVTWSYLAGVMDEHMASDAVSYLLTSAVVDGQQEDGEWVYRVVARMGLEVAG